MNTYPGRVSKWRTRFARLGIEGLKDAPRTGPPPRYDESTERRILAVLDETPPKATWTGKLVAKRLGDASFASPTERP
ncbi:MAG: helix-turn-helix domain-containing protein [Planctomycetes bacterium]|nr:helix-turn-helix domain-containing protein [Planctomycetota bacterium]